MTSTLVVADRMQCTDCKSSFPPKISHQTPAKESVVVPPSPIATEKEEKLFKVGCGVQLAPDFEEYSDAKEGPLKPGDIGVLIEDDGSSKPFRVEFDGKRWWYDRSALRVAELSKETFAR
jgi:hypothetical protein